MHNIFRLMAAAWLFAVAPWLHAGNLKVTITPSQAVTAGAQWRVDGGVWRASGTTVKNLSDTTHRVEYKTVSGWITPAAVDVSLTRNVTTSISGTYVTPASLKITLTPGNAQWRLDGGSWKASGATISSLAPGNHLIEYSAVQGYLTPSNETVSLAAGENRTLTRAYTVAPAAVTVNLNPAQARWNLNNGPWQASGATAQISGGNHVINYEAVAGYTTPQYEVITLVAGEVRTISRTYAVAPAAVMVILTPETAQWRINGGTWRASRTWSEALTAGTYTIEYGPAAGYDTLPPESITVAAGDKPILSRTYPLARAAVTMNLTPSTAQWSIDRGPWQPSGARVGSLAPGDHIIRYLPVTGYLTPQDEIVTLTPGEDRIASRAYDLAPAALKITLSNIQGKWRVDGGPWHVTTSTVTHLAAGDHTVEYAPVSGYLTPPTETVTLIAGQTTELTRQYLQPASVSVTLSPATANWRVDDGAWQTSGVILSGLSPGTHSLQFGDVSGYTTPTGETFVVAEGENKVLTRTYQPLPVALTVQIAPAAAQFRVDGGAWLAAGTSTSLLPGTYLIEYGPVPGYSAPSSETVTLLPGEPKTVSRTYIQLASLTVTLTPEAGRWRVDGGAWQSGGGSVIDLSPGEHTVDYAAIANHTAPATEIVTLLPGENKAFARSYTPDPATLNVTLNPAEAQWRIDGGSWNNSSSITLAPGTYLLEFSTLADYQGLPAETLTFQPGETKSISRSYTLKTASVRVHLTPAEAEWRVDDGPWMASGATASGLAPGNHQISYLHAPGYEAPENEAVTLSPGEERVLTRAYAQLGSITVNVMPVSARWRVSDPWGSASEWQTTGATVPNLSAGEYYIYYEELPGYLTPEPSRIVLGVSENKVFSQTYSRLAKVTVNLTPANARWMIQSQWGEVSSDWQPSGATVPNLPPGSYSVYYEQEAPGYYWLPPDYLTLNVEDNIVLDRTFPRLAKVTVNMTPANARWCIQPQWGGPITDWQPSGATVSNLHPGNYTVHYEETPGYFWIPPDNLTLNLEDNIVLDRTLPRLATVTVNMTPANARWCIQPQWGGPITDWQPSGATVSNLHPGNYTVHYEETPGYFWIPPDALTLNVEDNIVLDRTLPRLATVTVNMTPANARWCIQPQWGGPVTDWQPSGATVSNLHPGNYTVHYEEIPGYFWIPPDNLTLNVEDNIVLSRALPRLASITVNMTPADAKWYIYDPWTRIFSAPLSSGTTISNLRPGEYVIAYQEVPGYWYGSRERITLNFEDNIVLDRSLPRLPTLTVNVTPGNARWYLGAAPEGVPVSDWQSSGGTVSPTSPGYYYIHFEEVPGYVTPAPEMVSLDRVNENIVLNRTFETAEGVLLIETVPRLATELGIAQWRINGGVWRPCGEMALVPFGQLELEFKPAPGWDIPLSQTITVTPGEPLHLEADYHPVHRIKFFIHEDLAATIPQDEIGKLWMYAEHVQRIFLSETNRSLVFDFERDIIVCSQSPFTAPETSARPEIGFELWVYAELTDNPAVGSYGGIANSDVSGAGGADQMKWDKIYGSEIFSPGSPELEQYWKQIHQIVRCFMQTFGAGKNEYSNLAGMPDPTGVAPFAPTTGPVDSLVDEPFWNARTEYWVDPLFANIYGNERIGSPISIEDLLANVHFASPSKGVISGLYRDPGSNPLPDLSSVKIQIRNSITGESISNATVRVWNRQNPGPAGEFEHQVTPGAEAGDFHFSWSPYPQADPSTPEYNAKLIKVHAPGYTPLARWITIYDAQKAKCVDRKETFEVIIDLSPSP